jgi:hypothetical protein
MKKLAHRGWIPQEAATEMLKKDKRSNQNLELVEDKVGYASLKTAGY